MTATAQQNVYLGNRPAENRGRAGPDPRGNRPVHRQRPGFQGLFPLDRPAERHPRTAQRDRDGRADRRLRQRQGQRQAQPVGRRHARAWPVPSRNIAPTSSRNSAKTACSPAMLAWSNARSTATRKPARASSSPSAEPNADRRMHPTRRAVRLSDLRVHTRRRMFPYGCTRHHADLNRAPRTC